MPHTAQMLTAKHAPRRAAPTGTAAPERPGLASLLGCETAVPRRGAPSQSLLVIWRTPPAAARFGTETWGAYDTLGAGRRRKERREGRIRIAAAAASPGASRCGSSPRCPCLPPRPYSKTNPAMFPGTFRTTSALSATLFLSDLQKLRFAGTSGRPALVIEVHWRARRRWQGNNKGA